MQHKQYTGIDIVHPLYDVRRQGNNPTTVPRAQSTTQSGNLGNGKSTSHALKSTTTVKNTVAPALHRSMALSMIRCNIDSLTKMALHVCMSFPI